MKQAVWFTATSVALVAVCGLVMTLIYETAADRRGIVAAGLLAVSVQLVSFGILKRAGQQNVFAGWGVGTLLRLLSLVVFALVITRRFGFPSTSATLSLALFLFVSTLVEPLFLKS